MNKKILNYDIFYIGDIIKVVKNGYMVKFGGKIVFINSDKKFNLNQSVVVGYNGRSYFIFDKAPISVNSEKRVKIT